MRRLHRQIHSSEKSTTAAYTLIGLVSSTGATVTFCEGKDGKGFFEQIAKKDGDGNTDWAGTVTQVTSSDFWDKVATASGEKVS